MLQSSIIGSPSRRKGLALAVIVAAQFMVVLDIAIVNVALPAIKGDLHFAEGNLQWVISAYAILFGGALLLGVLLGGFLTSYLNWSWVFFINVPVGIAVIAAAPLVLAESRGQGHRHFDVAGAASVTAGVMLLVYAMTRATQEGWGSVATVSLL